MYNAWTSHRHLSGDFKLGRNPESVRTQEHLHFYKLRTEKSSKSQGMNVYGRISDAAAGGHWGMRTFKDPPLVASPGRDRAGFPVRHAGCEMSAYSPQMVDLRCL